jgi:hypothetical protein
VFFSRSTITVILSAALFTASAFASHVHRAPTSGQTKTSSKTKATSQTKSSSASSKSHKGSKRKTTHRPRGQQSIDSQRATQIQQALIRVHYLTGEPSGSWDAASIAAMQKFQASQGWQTKLMPDSRALKKLGLGPDYSTAINAKEGSFGQPTPTTSIPAEQASGFAAAAGVNQ